MAQSGKVKRKGNPTPRAAILARRGVTANSLEKQSYTPCEKNISGATRINYTASEALWEEFCEFIGDPSDLQKDSPVPPPDKLKRFMEFWAGSSIGRIGDEQKPNLTSSFSVYERIQSVIFRRTGKEVSRKTNEDMRAWIRTELVKKHGINLKSRKKGECDQVIHDQMKTQLWCLDSDEFLWERNRVQVGFLMDFLQYSAGRPGAITATGYYPDVYLAYRDIEVVLIRLLDGSEKFGIVPTQRWRKGEKEVIDSDFRILWPEENNIKFCPVQGFLSMAFADNAFESIANEDQLSATKLGSEEGVVFFPFKPDMLDKPFLINPDGSPFTYQSFWRYMKLLSYRCGHTDYSRPYDRRRFGAGVLDENSSTAQRNQVLGQSDTRVYMKSYQSRLSNLDVKGLMLRNEADPNFTVAPLRRNRRRKRLPDRLPSRRNQQFLKDWKERTKQEPGSRDKLGKQARTAAWKNFRKTWTEKYEKEELEIEVVTDSKIPKSVELLGNLDEPGTKARIMMRYDSNRECIRSEAATSNHTLRTSPAFRAMIKLAQRDYSHPAVFYPGEEPVKGRYSALECRNCRLGLDKKTLKQQQIHIRRCAIRHKTLSADVRWPARMCYRCDKWFDTLRNYREHCKNHLEELDKFCGILRLRNIVVSGGRCPFCLSNKQLTAWGEFEKMVTQFTNSGEFLNHLRTHYVPLLQHPNQEVECPHPGCAADATKFLPFDLLHHFYDDHGIVEDLFGTEKFSALEAIENRISPDSEDEDEDEDEAARCRAGHTLHIQTKVSSGGIQKKRQQQKRRRKVNETLIKDVHETLLEDVRDSSAWHPGPIYGMELIVA